MHDHDAVDLELTIRPSGEGSVADARLTDPGSQGDARLATDVPVALDPRALLARALDPVAYGRTLTAQVFADLRLRDAWRDARRVADGANLPLRLRLRLTARTAGIHALRWETLRDPITDVPLATDARLLLVRSLDTDNTRPITLEPKPALSALFVVANPSDLSKYGMAEIDVAGEVGRVRKAIGGIALTVIGDVRRATLSAIQDALRAQPTIFCLMCHGKHTGDDTNLWLENNDGTTAHVNGSVLTQILSQSDRPPLLVILIACEGGGSSHHDGPLAALGPRLAQAGVGAVLAMQAKLSMSAAKRLLPVLFETLVADGRIDRAVSIARAALGTGTEWWVPALWLRTKNGQLWAEAQPDTDPLALLATLPLDTLPDPAPLAPGSRMPFSRNPFFVGRAADLGRLAATLKGEGSAAAIGQVAVATGMGGIGKTNVATEFVHRYGQFFAGGVFWMSFADPAGVPGEIAACGVALDIPGFNDLKRDEQVQRVQAVWQQPLPRLLVFDNCDDATPGQAEALVQQWKPTTGGCRVLITSRRATWSRNLGIATLALGVLSRPESIALLRKHRPDLAEDDPALHTIAEELGDLPLALHLAGSFLETYQHSDTFGDPTDFLAELRDQRLLDHDALKGIDVTPSSTNHDLHVARTFALSYKRLDVTDTGDTLALRLLARAACLAPGEPIPRDLLLATLEIAEDDRATQRQAEKSVQRVVALGLLDAETSGALVLHRLLHAFVGAVAEDAEAQGAVEQVLIRAAYQHNETGYPSAMQPIAAHLRYATDRTAGRDDERAATLCGNLAYHLEKVGDYAAARPLYERALAIYEQALGPSHPDTASSLNNLAGLFESVSDYAAARPLYERALAIREQALGPSHPSTAQSLNNLAGLHYAVGDYAAARPLYERALAIWVQALGPDHPNTQSARQSLAAIEQRLAENGG
jgi:tetratricopeptide (TPR) repeat protein